MAGHIGEFAARLAELKARSGRSYGALAGRLNVSTSTLHRYCNGAAVPTEYATVERFARLCGASPEELVALHRRWLLADAERRGEAAEPARRGGAPAEVAVSPDGEGAEPHAGIPDAEFQSSDSQTSDSQTSDSQSAESQSSESQSGASQSAAKSDDAPGAEPGPAPRRVRRRRFLIPGAIAGIAAIAAAVPLTALTTRAARSDDGHASAAVPPAATAVQTSAATSPASGPAASPTSTPTASPSQSPNSTASPTTTAPSPTDDGLPAPFTVDVLADNWDSECGQWFYAAQPPSQVPPPPGLPDVPLWAAPLGAVPADHLRLQLTAQGTESQPPVVLHTVYVHIVSDRPAPKGYGYVMGSGCGGGLDPAAFSIDLDAATPRAKAISDNPAKLQDFPFQVSKTDSQVLDVDASTADRDISWTLELVWSRGDRQGRMTVDDHGHPFRTIGLQNNPLLYLYDGQKWIQTPLF